MMAWMVGVDVGGRQARPTFFAIALYPFVALFRLTPNRRHTAANVSSRASTASTNRIRSSMVQVSIHPIGKVLLAN
jgi:hypothetical protein